MCGSRGFFVLVYWHPGLFVPELLYHYQRYAITLEKSEERKMALFALLFYYKHVFSLDFLFFAAFIFLS